MYYALTGDTFDGKQAKEIGFVNFFRRQSSGGDHKTCAQADGEAAGRPALATRKRCARCAS
jgi:enoyl-CoA hydratase/carnithine racemase